jgi:predicted DNA-binding transcriptional regulator YafY
MPSNKHASFRYRILNECFSNRGHRKWSLDDLIETVSQCLQEDFGINLTVSKRTIQGDINVMRSAKPRGFSAPIKCQMGFYFYKDPDYTIEKNALGQEEQDLLREAVSLLRQLPGLPQLPALEMLLKRVNNNSPVNVISQAWIKFETNPAVHGLEWLGTIYKAIAEQQVILLEYHPFTADPMEILLHPYLLKEWHNRWYIFGRNDQDKLWNLALDRIEHISIQEMEEFKSNDLFDPETWFDDIVGVSKQEGASVIEILFETSYLSSRYLETRPIHPSQQLIHQENGIYRFSLKVILNHEVVNELLRFGNEIKVIGPAEVVEILQVRSGRS